jgi:hypothetical protein
MDLCTIASYTPSDPDQIARSVAFSFRVMAISLEFIAAALWLSLIHKVLFKNTETHTK